MLEVKSCKKNQGINIENVYEKIKFSVTNSLEIEKEIKKQCTQTKNF